MQACEFCRAALVVQSSARQPIGRTVLGAVFLGEQLGLGFVVGSMLMADGIYLVSTDETIQLGNGCAVEIRFLDTHLS